MTSETYTDRIGPNCSDIYGVNAVKKGAKKGAEYTGKLAKYLGFGGTMGGLIGLTVAGPVGGLVGIVVGKNTKAIGNFTRSTAKSAGEIAGAVVDAESYEQLDPDAKYEAQPVEGRHRLDKKLGNILGAVERKAVNCGRYRKLKKVASAVSEEEGKTVSPETIYTTLQARKVKEGLEKDFKEVRRRIFLKRREMMQNRETVGQADIEFYNGLVETQFNLGAELGISDPSQFYEPIVGR